MHKEYIRALEHVLCIAADFVWALLCFMLFSESSTENVVLFTLEVMVESCHLVSHGAKRRATAAQLSHGACFYWRHVAGRYLLFGIRMFQEEHDSTALKL